MPGSQSRGRCCMLLSVVLLATRDCKGGVLTAASSYMGVSSTGRALAESRSLQDTSTVSSASVFPTPVAHFPLAGNFVGRSNVSTTVYNGMGFNHTWEVDADAGTVLQCFKGRNSRIELPAVRYGRQGPWAINLWFKPSNEAGNQFQYLFSHNSTEFSDYTGHQYSPNQIRLYFPEIFHPAYGVLRALVKDSDSTANIASHLDSDGRVGHTNTTTDSQPYDRQFLADGLWHMATLTTLTNISSGLPGYAMLLDGYLVGMQAANRFYFPSNGSAFAGTDAGRPMMLDGKIVLCSHSDEVFSRLGEAPTGQGSRHYNGGISQLSIFDTYLSLAHVWALYHQGPNSSLTGSSSDILSTPSQSTVKERGIVQSYPGLPPTESLTPQQMLLQSLPSPAAFFPLSDGSLLSDSLLTPDLSRAFRGGSMNATFVEDPDTFGRTLECSKTGGSRVWLRPPPYFRPGTNGRVTFSINLWFKVGDSRGKVFQYLLSQMGKPDGDEWGPSQMAVYFPEQQHSRYGVLRAVVKDTTNENNSSTRGEMVFLDSDGRVADNAADPQLSQGNPMTDGKWHMVTVTTQPDLSTGFLLYLDGDAVGEMKRGRYTGSNGTVSATGGGNMNLTAIMVLCERADDDPYRGFDGRLSSLGIWTSVLTPANISALYDYGLSRVPYMGNITIPESDVEFTPVNSSMSPTAATSPVTASPSAAASPAPLPAQTAALPPPSQSWVRDSAAAGAQQESKERGLARGAVAGIVVGVVAAFVLASALAFVLFRSRKRAPVGSGKFETFRDEAGSFPVSTTAPGPNARNLTTQDSSKFLMP